MTAEPGGKPKVLIVFATDHGQTARIAGRIGAALDHAGCEHEYRDAADDDPDPSAFDAVVVAGSVHRSHHQSELVDWVKRHRLALGSVPNAFLSVSLTAAEGTPAATAAARECIDDFAAETGWDPDRSEAIAGALQYREYDSFTRVLMRLLMKAGGHPTDASRDYDYTDWGAVQRLGEQLGKTFVAERAASWDSGDASARGGD